jgi:Dehydrogenases with different specificities (related to short-chain alcohol dehydrogenases)
MPEYSKMRLKADATYLVTGGSSGFGLASAVRLARRGAKHILLLSRRGIIDAQARETVESIRASGVNVIDARADVADREKLFACLDSALGPLPQLAGIIHAAAVLDDALIGGLDERRIQNALAAKVLGASHLHVYSLQHPVDFFVLYSSVSSVFGNPGQSLYVAANSALETLGSWRRAQGLPAQVIGWGPIADTGMMARQSQSRDQLFKVLGVSPTQGHDALYWLEHCIVENMGENCYFGLDWHSRADLPVLALPRYNRLRPAPPKSESVGAPTLDELRALPYAEAFDVIIQVLSDEITRVLRMPKDRLDADTPLVAQGMDSLMAVELALAIEQKFELPGYTLSLSEASTIKDLAGGLCTYIKESGGAGGVSPGSDAELLQGLEKKHGFKLSDQKLESVMQSMKEQTHEQ